MKHRKNGICSSVLNKFSICSDDRDVKNQETFYTSKMGNDQSKNAAIGYHVLGEDPLEPVQSRYKPDSVKNYGLPTPESRYLRRKMVKTNYSGIWSSVVPSGEKPAARMGQAYAYDSVNDRIIIAYGTDSNGMFLDDCWAYDIRSETWTILNARCGEPRTNPGAVLWKRTLVIFGGGRGTTFFNDIHGINIDTGQIVTVDVVGDSPIGRMNPLMFSDASNIFMWSGIGETVMDDAYSFNLETREWTPIHFDHAGRAAATVCPGKDPFTYYVFGSSKLGLLSFDSITHSLDDIKCFGQQPPTGLSKVSMAVADEFLFLLGGERNADYTYVFALDIDAKIWFAFHIEPDNKTVSLDDGKISREGSFLLPREHSAAMVYSPNLRALVSVMGSKMEIPPPVYTIQIGDALSVLHLKNDMLDILHRN